MLLSQLQDGVLVPYEAEARGVGVGGGCRLAACSLTARSDRQPVQQKLLLLVQALSSHEDLHLGVEGKRAVILAEAVQQLGVLEDVPLVTN